MTNIEYWRSRHPVRWDDDGSGAETDAWDEWVVLTAADHRFDDVTWEEARAAFEKWCDEKRF